ncbi:unnamed protein product [Acanthoscelides obtectus]|uniref:Uncharacterized protein n=1 Tax=Acanthoscelides obtectus TaxID=200917 RepID=A0A9P0M3A9_ACAOB|nr:unnamed protein product [Acanthoscelides obtectus]CAK1686524.1 hypothetical protein AOBTE_LOCUS35988 [Acanthoscelides obtectus]
MKKFLLLTRRSTEKMIAGSPRPRTKFPASVHVLGVLSSEGDVMPPHFFENGQTVNKEVYVQVLTNDGAPAQTSHLVQTGHRITWRCSGAKSSGPRIGRI